MIDDQGVLYIEPSAKVSAEPVIDELTRKMVAAFRESEESMIMWRGFHMCACGAASNNKDYVLPNGDKTNSLCVHYLAFHRDEVPASQLEKVQRLNSGEAEPTDKELNGNCV